MFSVESSEMSDDEDFVDHGGVLGSISFFDAYIDRGSAEGCYVCVPL